MKKNQSALIALFISLCVANASAQVVTGRAVTSIGSGVTAPVVAPLGGAGRVSAPSFGVSPVSLRSFTPSLAVPAVLPSAAAPEAVPAAMVMPAPSISPAVVPAVGAPQAAPKAAELLDMKEELSLTGAQAAEMPADGAHASGAAIMDKVLGVRAVPVSADGSFLMPGASFSGSASSSRSGLTRSKGSRRGMPVEDDSARDNGPDGTDGLDDLGNPARRQDDGPDTVSDEFGGDRGGSNGAFLGTPGDVSIQVGMLGTPSKTSGQTVDTDKPVVLIVKFSGQDGRRLMTDSFLSSVDVTKRQGVQAYADAQDGMLQQIESLGVDRFALSDLSATPTATVRRINSAVFRVSSSRVQEFTSFMASQGHQVYDNDSRKIIKPIPVTPENVDPTAPAAVTLDETLKIVRAGSAHQAALEKFGPAEMGPVTRLAMKLVRFFTGSAKSIPQPKVAVIDTGVDTNHPMLKGVKVKNETTGENIDDIGHGSWVTADVLNIGRWLKDVTHYKTFSNGGATLEDILKSLTDAGNDGNIIMSNSWGSDDGDPNSPDSQLVRKLAEEGRIMVFAAGNSGPGKNTIGSPAIVYYKDAKTGAVRVLSVAASDRKKKIAYFSSRGPRSAATQGDQDYPHRPDLTSVGHNKDSAWPTNLSDADRTDPVYGPVKAISGTSMSAPDIAGAIAHLAQLFGVTEIGEKLDAVVNAVMATLEKTGQSPDLEGDGFINMDAAYDLLKETMEPATPGFVARVAAKAARWFDGLMG
ncbi:MAG: S8 family serine peptidase [Elusimicrobia bacterium]|nr:S8 family serine peptidase [Elusimicrobiota bacterium]